MQDGAEPSILQAHLEYGARKSKPTHHMVFSNWKFGEAIADDMFVAKFGDDYEGIAMLQRAEDVTEAKDATAVEAAPAIAAPRRQRRQSPDPHVNRETRTMNKRTFVNVMGCLALTGMVGISGIDLAADRIKNGAAVGRHGAAVKGDEGYAAVGRRGAVVGNENGSVAVGRRGTTVRNEEGKVTAATRRGYGYGGGGAVAVKGEERTVVAGTHRYGRGGVAVVGEEGAFVAGGGGYRPGYVVGGRYESSKAGRWPPASPRGSRSAPCWRARRATRRRWSSAGRATTTPTTPTHTRDGRRGDELPGGGAAGRYHRADAAERLFQRTLRLLTTRVGTHVLPARR